jgi:hypothetical protein
LVEAALAAIKKLLVKGGRVIYENFLPLARAEKLFFFALSRSSYSIPVSLLARSFFLLLSENKWILMEKAKRNSIKFLLQRFFSAKNILKSF